MDDETRGRSQLGPKKFKGDVLVQVWIDARMLATLSNWLSKEDIPTRFLSEVVREPLRMLVERLVEAEEIDMVEDTVVARKLLSGRYHLNLNRGGKGKKNVLHNTILSGLKSKGNVVSEVSEEPTLEEIKLMIQQQRHKSKQSKEDLAKQLNDAKESGVIDRS